MAVWRLQVNTKGNNIFDYCYNNHVAAMGWSLDDIYLSYISHFQNIS